MADLDTLKADLDNQILAGLNSQDYKVIATPLTARAAIASIQRSPGTTSSEITSVSETAPSVSTASSIILAANLNRKDALIINTGTTDIYISRSGTTVIGRGILLKAGGSVYEINSTNLYKGAISAIASAATSLLVCEGV